VCEEGVGGISKMTKLDLLLKSSRGREEIRKLVKDYNEATGMHFYKIWDGLYKELDRRWNIDLYWIGKDRKKGTSLLKVAEEQGYIDILHDVAYDVLYIED